METRVGFVGLGHMGLPMALNILKAGFPLWVYNRTKDKAAPLLEKGGKWAPSLSELAAICDILVSMVSNTASPILQAMSRKIFDLGERPSQASLFKLCNNFMILSLIETFSEAAAMLEKGGISTERAAEIWGSSLFDCLAFHSYTPMICKRNFEDGGFALNLGLKDIRILQGCADRNQVPMSILSELHEKLLTSMNLGRGAFDWSAIALLARDLAGLKS
jgi:3-hydroxyisobutyrate dehydrogenase-like beta-hydroxyacid dehydrogenase